MKKYSMCDELKMKILKGKEKDARMTSRKGTTDGCIETSRADDTCMGWHTTGIFTLSADVVVVSEIENDDDWTS